MLFDLGIAYEPAARGTASKKFVARVFHLTEAGELACIDSREVSLFAARRLECRARRSDALDVEIYPAEAVPPVPEGIKAIPRLRGARVVRVDPDNLFDLVKRSSSKAVSDESETASSSATDGGQIDDR